MHGPVQNRDQEILEMPRVGMEIISGGKRTEQDNPSEARGSLKDFVISLGDKFEQLDGGSNSNGNAAGKQLYEIDTGMTNMEGHGHNGSGGDKHDEDEHLKQDIQETQGRLLKSCHYVHAGEFMSDVGDLDAIITHMAQDFKDNGAIIGAHVGLNAYISFGFEARKQLRLECWFLAKEGGIHHLIGSLSVTPANGYNDSKIKT